MEDAATPAEIVPLREYRETRQRLFPSAGSLEWFVRMHKARLVDAGALLMIRGSWYIDAGRMESAHLAIAREDAQRAVRRFPVPATRAPR